MEWIFADCCLDLNRRTLRRDSKPVPTTPKVFDLLVYLAKHRNRVISRDELIDAIWGGRLVSDSTVASHVNAVRIAVGDDGQQQSVIKTIARKGFHFVAELIESQIISSYSPPDTTLQDSKYHRKISIAVLPFINLSGDPGQDYLADGVIEDVITALSRYRWMFVVARNSSFTYKNRNVDVKQIGLELGVRYILEGSWRKEQNRVRINGQLVDATTGATHWASRFEGIIDSIFDFQDEIANSVVGAIAPQLEQVEIDRTRHKPTESLSAYDCYLRGMAQLYLGTHDGVNEAMPMFRRAIEYDPDFASAYAMAAWCYCWRKINGWMNDRSVEMAEGERLARRAIELGKYDAVALTRSGHALSHLAGDLDEGIALLDQARELNPNLATAWFLGAFCYLWHGQTSQAIERFTRAMQLSPLDPELYRMQLGMAIAYYFMEDFAAAIPWAEKVIRSSPSLVAAQVILVASQAMLGMQKEVHQSIARLRLIAPTLSHETLANWLPDQSHERLKVVSEGLVKAGLKL